jgi:ketosteroid isomerase-like protein
MFLHVSFSVRIGVLSMLLAFAIATLAACTPRSAPAPTAGNTAAIRAARAAQNAAIATHDLDSVAQFWTEDVVVSAGLGRVIRGRADYQQAFRQDSGMVYERTPDHVELSAEWPLAFETGHWTGRRGAQGAPLIGGRYSAQWVRQAGRWLIRSELFVALTCAGEACRWPIAIS